MSQVQINNYVFDTAKVLGKGSTGTVFLGVDIRNGAKVAVKVIELKTITNQVTKYLLQNQVKALQITNHPNVLHAYQVIADHNCYYVVTNYCPHGTLEDYIKKAGRIPEREALKIFKQIVEGYASISSQNILHRDLKPSNILFSESYQPVICDFGYCQITGFLPKPKLQYNVGSPAYMAPESITGNMYSQGSEVWSLGTILYQMLQGVSFSHGREVMQAIMDIKRKGAYAPEGSSEFSKDIIKRCMALKPVQRASVRDLLILLNGGKPRPRYNLPLTQSVEFVAPKNLPNIQQPNLNRIKNPDPQRTITTPEVDNFQKTNPSSPRNNQQELINLQRQQHMLNEQKQLMQNQPIKINPGNITMAAINLEQSVIQDRPPSSPSQPTFRPMSSRLGIDEHNNLNTQNSFNKGDVSGLSKPEDFPQYLPSGNQNNQSNIQSNINTDLPYHTSSSSIPSVSIPSQMRNQYIESNYQNIQHQNRLFPQSNISQNFPTPLNEKNQYQFQHLSTIPANMLNSKRSIGSNYSQNEMISSLAFINPTGGIFAKNTVSNQNQTNNNPFLKTTKSKVSFADQRESNSLQQLQKIKPSAMLMGLSKSRPGPSILTESSQRNKIKSNTGNFQTSISFARPNTNNVQHPYYAQSHINMFQMPTLNRPY